MFSKIDENGKHVRFKVGLDCSQDPILTEQSHKNDVDINYIVKKHGIDMIQQTALLKSAEYQFDDVPGNDFQEAMLLVTKAQQTFDDLPSDIRKKFDNEPAKFLDFVQDPKNTDQMVEMGLAQRIPTPQPVQVTITPAPADPPADPPPATP